jgi:hypothetical protein
MSPEVDGMSGLCPLGFQPIPPRYFNREERNLSQIVVAVQAEVPMTVRGEGESLPRKGALCGRPFAFFSS